MTHEQVIEAFANGDWLWYVNGDYSSTARRHFESSYSIVSGTIDDLSCKWVYSVDEIVAAMQEVAPLDEWYAE